MHLLPVLDTFLVFRIVDLLVQQKNRFYCLYSFCNQANSLANSMGYVKILLNYLLFYHPILFAIISGRKTSSDNRKDALLVLVSVIRLVLSIFIKIPTFTMIRLISYLAYTQNKKRLRLIA